MHRRHQHGSQTNIHRFVFTSIKKVHLGENFTVKWKMWDNIQDS